MPAGMTHEQHLAEMKREAEMKARGAVAMGFDQDAAVHHFLLAADGGTIQVEVADPTDAATRDAIRRHLQEIAAAFAGGDFRAPVLTHAETPDGAATMQRLASSVTYTFSPTPDGGRVRITTAEPEALAAIHEFLRYQIREHRTGDLLSAPK
jgi:hypothetical protein